MRKRHVKHNYSVGGISVGLFCLLLMALLFPNVGKESYAVDCALGEESCTTTMAETEVGVKARTTIALAISPNVTMEVVPTSIGTISSASTKLGIATNSNDGYALYMQSESDTGDLVSIASSASGTIKNTQQQDVTLDDLEKNAYGYALTTDVVNAGTTYSTIPTTGSIIQKTTSVTPTEGNYAYGDTYYLSFGVKVGTDLPAGTYAGSVMISAVANPKTLATMFDLNYMQDMTSDICTNTREGYTKQLIDTRDGKSYWVAKLKDGNCWMTQNLALDLSTDKALTPSDSDVRESWAPGANTNMEKLTGTRGDANLTSEYSWNFGDIVLALPTNRVKCVNYAENDAATSDDNLGEVCRQEGAVDVSGVGWQPTFVSQSGVFNDENYDYVAVDEVNKTYDAHYLVGNYYQYNTATAGSGAGITEKNQNAKDSICPKGWRLPVSGTDASGVAIVNPNEGKGSFYQLFAAYGYKDSNFTGGGEGILLPELDVNSQKNVLVSPIYLVSVGIITLSYGYLRNFPTNVSLLTSTAYSSTHDFFLTIGSTVNPVAHDNKYYGYSVRCLAK